jgi:hypothetical protein
MVLNMQEIEIVAYYKELFIVSEEQPRKSSLGTTGDFVNTEKKYDVTSTRQDSVQILIMIKYKYVILLN